MSDAEASLREAASALIAAKAAYNSALLRHQAECDHEGTTVETGFRKGVLFDSLPHRACERCGFWEQGWRPKVLTGRAYPTADAVRARIDPQSEWVHPTVARLVDEDDAV